MTPKSLVTILDELKATKGSLAKAAILAEHKGRVDLQRLAHFTYEPTISFYLKPQKLPPVLGSTYDGMEGCEAIHETLASRRLTGLAAKAFYESTIAACTPEAAVLVNVMMERDFRCGIGDTTIGKTWPGLITETPYMRCALPTPAKMTKWPWGTPGFFAFSQPKADGMFANVTVRGDGVTVSSRNGQTFANGPHFNKIAEFATALAVKMGYSIQLHGEFVARKDGKRLPRELSNGIMNSLLNDGVLDKDAELVYVFWDCIPAASVAVKRYEVPYRNRYETVDVALAAAERDDPVMYDSDVFQIMKSRIVFTYAEAVEHFIELTLDGEEGSVVKKPSMVWFDGDSMEQVKMKITFAVELRIKGFNAGNQNGKHAKTFGSLQCESEDGLLATGVSGISDALRKHINDNRESYIDKIVTVSSNSIMVPSKSNPRHSLFLPRLEEIRVDKTVADTLPSILAQFEAAKQGQVLTAST